jgi:hypothetical protein
MKEDTGGKKCFLTPAAWQEQQGKYGGVSNVDDRWK